MMSVKDERYGVLVREDGSVLRENYPHARGTYSYTFGTNHGKGYKSVSIGNRMRKIHRLVAENFIPNPDNKPTVDHINRIRDDNRVCNLRWATTAEQRNNRKDSGIRKYGVARNDPSYAAVRLHALKGEGWHYVRENGKKKLVPPHEKIR